MSRLILTILMAGLALTGPALTGPARAQAVDEAVPETEAACLEVGGRWDRGGLGGQLLCFLPSPDAGKACTVAEDCSGFCLAESDTCSPETPLFGCFAIRELDGAEVTLCID